MADFSLKVVLCPAFYATHQTIDVTPHQGEYMNIDQYQFAATHLIAAMVRTMGPAYNNPQWLDATQLHERIKPTSLRTIYAPAQYPEGFDAYRTQYWSQDVVPKYDAFRNADAIRIFFDMCHLRRIKWSSPLWAQQIYEQFTGISIRGQRLDW